ncbi:tRNA lysidine(34) synthetase TilS [Pedosphaera parvula]|nr:tRNA lysidine(34) synthetase TilS [Pedosphaera parvula]
MSPDLMERVEQVIEARQLFGRGERILVGVSGGLDSMVLLEVLSELASKHDWTLAVAHLNHSLRGRSSDADERLVRRTAERLGCQCVVERAEVRKFGRKAGLSLEMAARRLRHEFLARSARKLGIKVVALAHHADDQVELFLLRLLRGASSEGLAGMDWKVASPVDKGLGLVRPLLEVRKSELEGFAQQEGVKFRKDATNESQEILRNRVRHELVPLLNGYQPALGKVIMRQMEILGAEGDFIDEVAGNWLRKKDGLFGNLAVAVQRRVIYRQLLELGVAGDFELVEKLRLRASRPVTVSKDMVVTRDEAGVVKTRQIERMGFNSGQIEINLSRENEIIWDGVRVYWAFESMGKKFEVPQAEAGREFLDLEKVGKQVILRHWRAGDRFWPIGMRGAVKLQDFFTNQKVLKEKRRKLILATTLDGEIFWVEGLRLGERFKLDKGTECRLKWSWDRL